MKGREAPLLVVNSPAVVHECIDGEVIVIHLETGCYYSLEGSGADVWRSIERGATAAGLLDELRTRYAGDLVEPTVTSFLDELTAEALIRPAEAQELAHYAAPQPPPGAGDAFTPPVLRRYAEIQDLIGVDPIHQVDEGGWPNRKLDPALLD